MLSLKRSGRQPASTGQSILTAWQWPQTSKASFGTRSSGHSSPWWRMVSGTTGPWSDGMRRYMQAPSSSLLLDQLAWSYGCRRLRWAQQQRRGKQVPDVTVTQLGSIVRRQCVVHDCSKRNCKVRQRGAAGEVPYKPHFYTKPILWARI